MYDIEWDDIFQCFYVPKQVVSELTEEELEAVEQGADHWLMDAAGIL